MGNLSAKRVLVGKPLSSHEESNHRLSKRIALAVFSSDALSSSAYATDEILLALAFAGSAASPVRTGGRPGGDRRACDRDRLLPADGSGLPERRRCLHRRPRQPRVATRA